MIANNTDTVSEVKLSTGPATAATFSKKELFLGIDAAKTNQVVVRFVPGEGAKAAEGMIAETPLKRVARLIKDGLRVHCVYEAGPPGFVMARQLIALGATCLVVRARNSRGPAAPNRLSQESCHDLS